MTAPTTTVDVLALRRRLARLGEALGDASRSADLAVALSHNASDAQLASLSVYQQARLERLGQEADVLAGAAGAMALAVESVAPAGDKTVRLRVSAASGMRAAGVLARQGALVLVDEVTATGATGAGIAVRVSDR